METESKLQIACVEKGADGRNGPFCPVCGKVSSGYDDQYNEVAPCVHLLFNYSFDAGEYVYQTLDFANRVEEYVCKQEALDPEFEEPRNPDDFNAMLRALGYGPEVFVLEITTCGFACGPTWETSNYGYNFDAEWEDDAPGDATEETALADDEH